MHSAPPVLKRAEAMLLVWEHSMQLAQRPLNPGWPPETHSSKSELSLLVVQACAHAAQQARFSSPLGNVHLAPAYSS